VPVLYYVAVFDPADGAEVMAAWQNLAATAPDELSSIGAATTGAAGLLIINGELRVEDGNVPAAREKLIGILQTHWFDLLPAPLRAPLVVDIDELTIVEGRVRRPPGDDSRRPLLATIELTTIEAANTIAMQVPMPTFNQWKLKSKYTFRSLTAAELQPVFEYMQTHAPADDPTKAAGFLNPLLMGGQSNRIDPDSAAVPAREGTVLWVHAGALWNDESVAAQALAFVDGLWAVLDQAVQSSTAMYGCPDLQLGSQLTTPPNLGYTHAYWSSPAHDFVPFLIGVKNKYDPHDLFKFAQSIPLAL
jgi:Berberine and berberine like